MGKPRRARPKRPPRLGFVLPLVLTFCLLAAATPTQAAEPLKIREVFPGSPDFGAGAEFVELQMSADGQSEIEGQELRFYEADGGPASTFTLPADVPNGQSQRTVLLATAEAASLGATSPDYTLPAADAMDPAGGAVCFTAASGGPPADCITWGSFPPAPGPFEPQVIPDPQSANATAFAAANEAGQSLHRDITRGCETYLDSPDDTGSSAADFAQGFPSPRNNSIPSPHGEIRCPPTASIFSGPTSPFTNPNNSPTANFTYSTLESEPGVEFQCHLDSHPTLAPPATPPTEGEWADCTAQPQTYEGLSDGFNRFWLRAIGENPSPGPAISRFWQLDATAPQTTITATPPEPSSGFVASFSFASSEPQSSFRCKLDSGPFQVCGNNASSGSRSYFQLTDGPHTFQVFATDNAGNEDPTPATHTFTVITAIGDLTPPDTFVISGPPNPSPSPNASFAYGSTEQGSTFECRLGLGPFAPCPPTGQSYGPLRNATYTFEVRATDPSGNVDSVPASHTWRVAAPPPKTRFLKAPPGRVNLKRGKKAKLLFRYRADKAVSGFRCRLNKQRFRVCKPTMRLRAPVGRHRFEVYAIDSLGNVEPRPQRRIVRVQRAKRGGGLF